MRAEQAAYTIRPPTPAFEVWENEGSFFYEAFITDNRSGERKEYSLDKLEEIPGETILAFAEWCLKEGEVNSHAARFLVEFAKLYAVGRSAGKFPDILEKGR